LTNQQTADICIALKIRTSEVFKRF